LVCKNSNDFLLKQFGFVSHFLWQLVLTRIETTKDHTGCLVLHNVFLIFFKSEIHSNFMPSSMFQISKKDGVEKGLLQIQDLQYLNTQ